MFNPSTQEKIMKEIEARKAILKRTDLTDGDKVIMMAILLTVD